MFTIDNVLNNVVRFVCLNLDEREENLLCMLVQAVLVYGIFK